MLTALVLFSVAAFLRLCGAISKRVSDSPVALRAGLIIGLAGIWVAMHGAGVWGTIWPLIPLALLALILPKNWLQAPAGWVVADATAVVLISLLAVPPAGFNLLILLAVAIPFVGAVFDHGVPLLPKPVQFGLPALAVLGTLGLTLLTPSTLMGGVRLMQTRLSAGTAIPSVPIPLVQVEYQEGLDLGSSPVRSVSAAEINTKEGNAGDAFLPVVSKDHIPGPPNEIVAARPIDITFNNTTVSGNPYDLVATVAFVHAESGKRHQTEMFYMGGDEWRARFTASQAGRWNYATASSDPDLNGLSGVLDIEKEDGLLGFVSADGQNWVRTGENPTAFVPQFVMSAEPNHFYNDPTRIESDIDTYIVEHGFNGLHVKVLCRWFDINQASCNNINVSSPNPDLRTFEALEQVILEVYDAGGTVHIWAWGDESRGQTPARWGYNQQVDQRLQRYIAARLGPLPGWTMGYGFDLFEWTNEEQLDTWHTNMHAHLGWYHLLGGRANKNELNQISELMDYSGYEQHEPDYAKYVETIETRPFKPSFSEDRFRVRNEGRDKDYTFDDTRQGLWRSGMAGGVANIWGYLLDGGTDELGSAPYPNKEQIKLYSSYFNPRFSGDLTRCNNLTNGVCLKNELNTAYIFYIENGSTIEIDLSGMAGNQPYLMLNTITGETSSGTLTPSSTTLTLASGNGTVPERSDWAIFVGDF